MPRGVMFQFFEWHLPSDGTLWEALARGSTPLARSGVTAVWLPPPYKGSAGADDTGYGAYDLYDLGEFDQKGSVRTKYGTADQFLRAVRSAQAAGMHAYVDVVFNHRMGGDALEEVEVEEVDPDDRRRVLSEPYPIRTWSHYRFPGREGRHSSMEWHWYHFTAFDHNEDAPDEAKIYRVAGKAFASDTSGELGNYDYLMGADVDVAHPEVQEDLVHWGRWLVARVGVDGFRLDAAKHISSRFVQEWLARVRENVADRELYAVAEHWSGDPDDLGAYLESTAGETDLFDVPLHFRFASAAAEGADFDLSAIFRDTLVERDPTRTVTFVDNHDSQPGQSLSSWVADWFKPLAYALILLRREGYPCVFYADYFGSDDEHHRCTSHRRVLDALLAARQEHAWGEQQDYFDHPNCVGWVWTGDSEHSPMAVVMSNSEAGRKRMSMPVGRRRFRDATGQVGGRVTTNKHGTAEFPCPAGGVSVWCPAGRTARKPKR